ncbi:MAG: efflux RND transporter periplasmic adaptor subunit [Pseudomonadota bacterium]|nr:efflux RND transporter periplasmic adaptor subunit [Pseudomonadota bacterium]
MTPKSIPAVAPRRLRLIGIIAAVSTIGLAVYGIADRARSKQEVQIWTNEQAIPSVTLVQPQQGPSEGELVLPGNVSAFYAGSIYGRVSGYVKDWHEDIGAHVKKGQVLAVIDSPDLDQQLAQTRADLIRAQANQQLANVTYDRWKTLSKQNIVSQQAKDEKYGDAMAKAADVQAAQANVARLEALASFKNLTAPFDGIVTARSVDIGDLVDAGGKAGKALFVVSDLHIVRIYVEVPQAFLGEMKKNLKATLRLPGIDEKFQARLLTTSNAISEQSRTALVQLLAENPAGKLWPGAFTEVHFHIPSDPNMLRVPATALIFSPHGLQVAKIEGQNKVVLSQVQLGRNLGNYVEILSGVSAADRIIDSPQETIASGDTVRLAGAPDQGAAGRPVEQAARALGTNTQGSD